MQLWLANSFACCSAPSSHVQISFIDRRIHFADSRVPPFPIFQAMLPPAYLSKKLTSPIPTKDGGTLHTILEACEYMAAIGKERELRPHWQQVRELMLQEPDVAAVSWKLRLAILKDAKLDVSKVPAK